jgi:hypothetical protein
MIKNRKHFVSLMLALILLMPTMVKLNHHHDHGRSYDEGNRSTTQFTHKCLICDFQYSTFLIQEFIPESAIFKYNDPTINLYSQFLLSNSLKYSFLLRAPPVLQLI